MKNSLKRPQGVTWLAVGVLILSGWNMLRFNAALQQWDFLSNLTLSLSPGYQVIVGLGWAIVGFAITLGLWWGWRWSRKGVLIAASVYTAQLWIERLAFTQSATGKQNAGFILGLTIATLLTIILILAQPKVQIFFGENNERKPGSED